MKHFDVQISVILIRIKFYIKNRTLVKSHFVARHLVSLQFL